MVYPCYIVQSHSRSGFAWDLSTKYVWQDNWHWEVPYMTVYLHKTGSSTLWVAEDKRLF